MKYNYTIIHQYNQNKELIGKTYGIAFGNLDAFNFVIGYLSLEDIKNVIAEIHTVLKGAKENICIVYVSNI